MCTLFLRMPAWRAATSRVCLLLALAGCGGGGTAPSWVAALRPVTAAGFDPPDGGQQVDIRPILEITFTGPLDPGSVGPAHVALRRGAITVPADVRYDAASRTIKVAPVTLDHDTGYTLVASGLLGLDGDLVPDARASFTTWVNTLSRIESADGRILASSILDGNGRPLRLTWFDGQGNVFVNPLNKGLDPSYAAYSTAEDGARLESQYVGPGPDGIWFNDDDVRLLTRRTAFDQDETRWQQETQYDIKYYDAFENIHANHDYLITHLLDHAGRIVYTAYQVDADDAGFPPLVIYPSRIRYDSAGRISESEDSDGPGADGIPYTADDVASRSLYTYSDDGRSVRITHETATHQPPRGDFSSVLFDIEQFDARGNLILFQAWDTIHSFDELDEQRRYAYDQHDNLISMEEGLSAVGTRTWYDTTH